MIGGGASGLGFLRRQEWAQLVPVGIGEGGQAGNRRWKGSSRCHKGSLPSPACHMEASGCCLMSTPEAGPVQAMGPLLRCFSQRQKQATHLGHTQFAPSVGTSTFFPSGQKQRRR